MEEENINEAIVHPSKLKREYIVGRQIGTLPPFGELRIGQHKKSGAQRAIRVYKKTDLDHESKIIIENEVYLIQKMNHPNILKIHGYFKDEKRMYIVTDLCKGGELFDELERR